MQEPIPAKLGKYQIVRRIAVGGMAEVYLAKVAGLGGFEKTLVIKRVLPELAENEDYIAMFRSEAKLASQLSHPNVVSIFDCGQDGDDWFLAMEFIDGPNLRTLFRRAFDAGRPIPFNLAAKILAYVCEGLAYAHEYADPTTRQPLGLIHRDATPDNILVGKNGEVKVVDFGLAKSAGQLHQTKFGTKKGKAAYMSPEYLRGQKLDRRADVFSLGIVFYELLTGARPFDTTDDETITRAILFEEFAPAATLRPETPPALQRILDRATAKDRNARYADCRALQLDLEAFILGEGDPVGPIELADLVGAVMSPDGQVPRSAPRKSGARPAPRPAPSLPAPVPRSQPEVTAPPKPFPRGRVIAWLLMLPLVIVLGMLVLGLDNDRRFSVDHPPPGTLLHAGAINVHAIDVLGEGRVVVLIHGDPGTSLDFAAMQHLLSPRHRTIAIDRPGYGWTDRPRSQMTVRDQARILHDALKALALDRPVLVGFDLGGAVITAWALDYPNEVGALVYVSPVADPVEGHPLRGPQAKLVEPYGRVIAFGFGSFFSPEDGYVDACAPQAPDPALIERGKLHFSRPTTLLSSAWDWRMLEPELPKLAARYGELKLPVEAIWGNQDRITGPSHVQYLADHIEGIHVERIDQAGHQLINTRPKEVVEAVLRAVERAK